MAKNVLKLIDKDDGVNRLDVVCVPEGFSFQIYDMRDKTDYNSVIISNEDRVDLIDFLQTAESK